MNKKIKIIYENQDVLNILLLMHLAVIFNSIAAFWSNVNMKIAYVHLTTVYNKIFQNIVCTILYMLLIFKLL